MLDANFKEIIVSIKKDVLDTRYKIMQNANFELINLYFRLGKIIWENSKYGNAFIDNLSIYLKLEFPNMKGFSKRNLSRMKVFYEEYKCVSNLPPVVANLPWTHNYLLIEKIKDKKEREWYANKCYENGWSKVVLAHQIELKLYQRQVLNNKLNNFESLLSTSESELAKEIIKDPYIFELENINEKIKEKNIESMMLEKIKNVLLEFGKGFSFVGSQYKVSTPNKDYFIDILFYHLVLKRYIVVELKNMDFKPEYIGQIGFYVTAIDETLKKEDDNATLGLLLCKSKDKISVEWALKSSNTPIGVSSYELKNILPKEIIDVLPTEKDINLYINDY